MPCQIENKRMTNGGYYIEDSDSGETKNPLTRIIESVEKNMNEDGSKVRIFYCVKCDREITLSFIDCS